MATLAGKQIRPEVARVVEQQAANAVLGGSDNEWCDYETAKRAISSACGFDAPSGQYDQGQFEMAIRAYCDLTNI